MHLLQSLERWPRVYRVLGIVLSERRYPLIIAIGLALIAYRTVISLDRNLLLYLYIEYLATYDFGFIRRGLVPQLLSFVVPRLTHFDIKVFAVAMLCTALASYIAVYARRFSLTRRDLPLLAFTIASPCVFKNAAFDFARFDILGFIGGVIALALPLGGFYSLAIGAICCLLCVIHEAQFLTYVPVIVTIAAIRLAASRDTGSRLLSWLSWREAIALFAIAATMSLVAAFGNADVPPHEFFAHIQARAVDPIDDRSFIWYIGPWENMLVALAPMHLWPQLYRSPRYITILLAHAPLFALAYAQTVRSAPSLRLVCWLGFFVCTIGFVIMFVISTDRARFFSVWIAGLVLIVHAIRLVRPASEADVEILQSWAAVAAAWVLVCIPRVGLFTP